LSAAHDDRLEVGDHLHELELLGVPMLTSRCLRTLRARGRRRAQSCRSEVRVSYPGSSGHRIRRQTGRADDGSGARARRACRRAYAAHRPPPAGAAEASA
jgi:hypothetical protein